MKIARYCTVTVQVAGVSLGTESVTVALYVPALGKISENVLPLPVAPLESVQ